MGVEDVRWIQRLNHFSKASAPLEQAVELSRRRTLTNLEQQGLIQAFEYTHELAWNTLEDFLEERGVARLYGSKDVTREAFRAGLIEDGEVWMHMIASRNLTSRTYNEETAAAVVSAIVHSYYAQFGDFRARMERLKEEPQG